MCIYVAAVKHRNCEVSQMQMHFLNCAQILGAKMLVKQVFFLTFMHPLKMVAYLWSILSVIHKKHLLAYCVCPFGVVHTSYIQGYLFIHYAYNDARLRNER